MKLFLPLGAIFFAAASCCCCGDFGSELSSMGIDIPGAGTPAVSIGGSSGTQAAPAAGGAVLAGTCGRFKSDSLTAPSGMTVMVCSEGGGADSIVLSGSGDPGEACKTIKGWAEGQGWATEFDTQASGTHAVTLKKATERLVIGCTSMAGQTTVSVSYSTM